MLKCFQNRSVTPFALANKKMGSLFTDQATSQRSHRQSAGWVKGLRTWTPRYQCLSCICNMLIPQLWLEIIFSLSLITSLLLSNKNVIQAEASWCSQYLREFEKKHAWLHPPPEECIRRWAKSTTAVKATKVWLRKHEKMLNGHKIRDRNLKIAVITLQHIWV